MNFTNKRKPIYFDYTLNNNNLEQVKAYKYLGITLTKKLLLSVHVNQVKTKANRTLNLLRRTLHGRCSKIAKIKAYHALAQPHLESSCAVSTPHQKQLVNALENVQKRASRWITAKWNKKIINGPNPIKNVVRKLSGSP